jgi:hypothetical protein
MRKFPFVVFLFLGAGALAAEAGPKSPRLFALDLKPGAMHEECLTLAKGRTVDYEWATTLPVDFNIHFHHGDEVSYPVKADNATLGKSRFSSGAKEDYCWMWTAKAATRLTGRIEAAK